MISPEQKKYEQMVNDINTKLEKLNSVEYIKFRDYNTVVLKQLGDEFKRKHFKDRKQFNLMKENRIAFLYNMFFEPKDRIKILLKKDNFSFINKTFIKEGIDILNKIFMTVNSSLLERKYDPIDPNSIYNSDSFNNALEILEIDGNQKLKFSYIKKQYDSKKEYAGGNIELKNKYNKAYILIREQYADYLTKYKLIDKDE
tara:strand:- start:378 stop:977 length:600 start_codon:yes stop_codon:yes gene_type:complete